MRLTKEHALCAVALFLLGGCGGSSESLPGNVYTGSYQGMMLIPSSVIGTISFKVDGNGKLTGQRIIGPLAYNIAGTVSTTGLATITDGSKVLTGQIAAPVASTVGAQLQGSSETDYLTLVINPSSPISVGNPLRGDYAGTIVNAAGQTEVVAFTVGASGTLSGSIAHYVGFNWVLGTVSGTVANDGTTSLSISEGSGSPEVASGQMSLNQKVVFSTLQASTGGSLQVSANQIP